MLGYIVAAAGSTTFRGLAISAIATATSKYGVTEGALNGALDAVVTLVQFGGIAVAAYGRWNAERSLKTGAPLAA